MVHFNSKYDSFQAAVNHSDGLAVLAILFKETKWDNVAFKPIINSFDKIGKEGMHTVLGQKLKLASLLPVTESFYRYTGSLVIYLIDNK